MARKAPSINLSDSELEKLNKWVNSGKTEQRMAKRAKIILLAERGFENDRIAEELNVSSMMVSKWRRRFFERRIDGLFDEKGRGHPPVYDMDARLKLIEEACRPPENTTHWSLRDLEAHLKEKGELNMDHATIGRILNSMDLKPHQYRMWLNSQDPDFEEKKMDVVGLYLNPPENALVISVDEKTGIQALGRKHPNKPVMIGSCEKMEFEYKRNGTKSLLAALAVHKGEVLGKCYDGHTNVEFIDFLEAIKAYYNTEETKEMEFHLIVDNLKVHKSENVRKWLSKNTNFIFHFTPTHASWLNQIELWFSILARKVLKRGIFNSKEELVKKIMEYIEFYNKSSKPFRWTYTGEPLKI